MIKIQIVIQSTKNTRNPCWPNAMLAFLNKKRKIGASGAVILLKKKSVPKMINVVPMLYLLSFKCVLDLLLAKTTL